MTASNQALWKLSKVDIRSPIAASGWPVARVELHHVTRGRVTDVASAPGALDGAFAAVSEMMGVPARVCGLDVKFAAPEAEAPQGGGIAASVLVHVTIEADGETFAGRAHGHDILHACVSAYVDAAGNASAARGHPSTNRGKVNC